MPKHDSCGFQGLGLFQVSFKGIERVSLEFIKSLGKDFCFFTGLQFRILPVISILGPISIKKEEKMRPKETQERRSRATHPVRVWPQPRMKALKNVGPPENLGHPQPLRSRAPVAGISSGHILGHLVCSCCFLFFLVDWPCKQRADKVGSPS